MASAKEPTAELVSESASLPCKAEQTPPPVAAEPMPEVASEIAQPVCDAETPLSPVASKTDDAEYSEVLARCAELRRTRQELLQVKSQVRFTIDQFATAFDTEGSETSESCLGDPIDDEELEEDDEVEPLSYEEALAEEEELEEEVEMLRESLETASAMVATIVQKSQQWSEHLEGLDHQIHLPADMPTKANEASNTSLGEILQLPGSGKYKQDRMKLPSLKLVATSEASSSTATPRSENDPESRMASARSEKNVVWGEV